MYILVDVCCHWMTIRDDEKRISSTSEYCMHILFCVKISWHKCHTVGVASCVFSVQI